MKGYRVAVVAPLQPLGQRIRAALEERSFPVSELKLFDAAAEKEPLLTQFESEVVVTQPLDSDLFGRLDVLFFGESAEREHVDAAVREGVLTFLFDDAGVPAPVIAFGVNDKTLPAGARLVRGPRPAASLLGAVLSALSLQFEIVSGCATVALPALERGKDGLDELQQQTLSVLSFKAPPTRVFHEQLAFNLILPSREETARAAGEGLGKEAAEIAGQEFPMAVSVFRAPVFTAYAASLWVALEGEPELADVKKALRDSKAVSWHEDQAGSKPTPSPLSVATLSKVQVARVRPDAGGFWFWVVADMTAVDPALQSVRLAEKLLGVPARRR